MGLRESPPRRSEFGEDRVRSSVQSSVGTRRAVSKPVEVGTRKMISNLLFHFFAITTFYIGQNWNGKRLVNKMFLHV